MCSGNTDEHYGSVKPTRSMFDRAYPVRFDTPEREESWFGHSNEWRGAERRARELAHPIHERDPGAESDSLLRQSR